MHTEDVIGLPTLASEENLSAFMNFVLLCTEYFVHRLVRLLYGPFAFH
jgi:hypothetical protein